MSIGEKTSIGEKIKSWYKNITMEQKIFLYLGSIGLSYIFIGLVSAVLTLAGLIYLELGQRGEDE